MHVLYVFLLYVYKWLGNKGHVRCMVSNQENQENIKPLVGWVYSPKLQWVNKIAGVQILR